MEGPVESDSQQPQAPVPLGIAGVLNHDVLQCILEYISPTYDFDLLDSSLSRGPQSPWCSALRMKKGLTLLSRNWNFPATAFLYRDIVIRRVGQLTMLKETLDARPQYGKFIHRLRIDCYVPGTLNKTTSHCLSTILERCPNLRSLEFGTFFITTFLRAVVWLSSESEDIDVSVFSILQKAPILRNVSFVVDAWEPKSYTLPLPLLQNTPQLVSLTISIPDLHDGMQPMSFPALQELRLSVTTDFPANKASCLRNLEQWSLPSLTHLWLVGLPSYSSSSWSSVLWRILTAHGSKLLFLDFSRCMVPNVSRKDNIMKKCPRLRHLVLSGNNSGWPIFRSATLHIDVWVGYCMNTTAFDFKLGWGEPVERSCITNLVKGDRQSTSQLTLRAGCGTIRFLSEALNTLPYLPTAIPPKHGDSQCDADQQIATTQPPRLHDIFGMRIAEWDSIGMLEDEYQDADWYDLYEAEADDDTDSDSVSDCSSGKNTSGSDLYGSHIPIIPLCLTLDYYTIDTASSILIGGTARFRLVQVAPDQSASGMNRDEAPILTSAWSVMSEYQSESSMYQ
ncbi:hypothetical protein NM688_g1267 [Phlebia brevispora]|uniref:Uncharacterized protein n=1 Tax=Phlebia brevispora TaxID=194682 RepID=A0ACC1TBZ3_9APHY|nr:hypothetical protein NM688_g1267 [Phlebia brevispora]